ncbi:hypothetical protein [Nonomuraea sp. NPDC049784]
MRTGVGPYGTLELPESWRQARLALAFAAGAPERRSSTPTTWVC